MFGWLIKYLDDREAMKTPTIFDNPEYKDGEIELRTKEFLKLKVDGK